jgi:Fe-S-cluster-containing hydrogenase component 2/flavodoxin
MKGIVIYYSATGSTAKIAKAMHRGMKEVMECDIASIKKAGPKSLTQYDVIALGAPIWYFREPANVRLFIYTLPNPDGKLCIPFCTHGASPTGFFWSMVPMLRKKGLTIIGYNSWYGSVYQVLHAPKPYLTDGHPDEIDLKEAENFGREMAKRALRIEAGERDLIPKLPKGPNADSLWRSHGIFRNFPPPPPKPGEPMRPPPPLKESPAKRTVNMEKCTYPTCTLCIDACPVNAIDFTKEPVVFRKSCLNCALCDKMCPQLAIEVDAETMQNRTQRRINMEKCTYPTCTLCVDHCPMHSIDFSVTPPVIKPNCEGDDLCWVICPHDAVEITNLDSTHARLVMREEMKNNHPFIKLLAEAEAKGRFRRLVPLDKVGWDNIIYKNPKHPRLVIEEE